MGEYRQGLRENFRGSFPYYIGFGQETSFEITVDIPIDAVYNISFFIPYYLFLHVKDRHIVYQIGILCVRVYFILLGAFSI